MAWDDELDYDFRGKLLQVLGKIEERQAAHTRAFEVHERQEDRRFEDGFKTVFASIAALEKVVEKRLVNLETRVDKIEGVTASEFHSATPGLPGEPGAPGQPKDMTTKPRSLAGDAWRDLRRRPAFWIGLVLVVVAAVLTPVP